MNLAKTIWSDEHLLTAKKMYKAGSSYDEIGEAIGRSAPAVYDMLRKKLGAIPPPQKSYFHAEAIGKDEAHSRALEDIRFASIALREACLDLFQRTANRFQIGMDDAAAIHLGYCSPAKCEPGTERIYRGQAAQRLAA